MGACEAREPGSVRGRPFERVIPKALFRHVARRTVHELREGERKFRCGRPCSDRYEQLAETSSEGLWPLCTDCF